MARTYTTDQGEAWDEISRAVYGSERHMDTLLGANPDLQDRLTLGAGTEVTVPELPEAATSERPTPPWDR